MTQPPPHIPRPAEEARSVARAAPAYIAAAKPDERARLGAIDSRLAEIRREMKQIVRVRRALVSRLSCRERHQTGKAHSGFATYDRVGLTAAQRRALAFLAGREWASPAEIGRAMDDGSYGPGVLKPSGAGRLGYAMGARLERRGFVEAGRLRGATAWRITEAGRAILQEPVEHKPKRKAPYRPTTEQARAAGIKGGQATARGRSKPLLGDDVVADITRKILAWKDED